MKKEEADKLREKYPIYVPLKVAAKHLAVSSRQLSKLVANGREPFSLIGADIGTNQAYIRIYTERLIAYLNGELLGI